jgi:hypothetical protein
MKRREFLKSTLVTAGLTTGFAVHAADPATSGPREFYELRLYHLKNAAKRKLFEDYARDAALPAFNRAGSRPVGVFFPVPKAGVESEESTAYMLIPFKSIEDFAAFGGKLAADADYHQAGAEFINVPATDPAFVRVESSLMLAFTGMPQVVAPAKTDRIFELRTYESHSKKANLKKIEMFNLGEIAIFRRNGLTPVFFGETLIGTRLPNLTYMLVYDDMAAHDQCWRKFVSDPDWKKLSKTPGYTDPEIVSHITNFFLKPAPYSQI